MAFNLEEHRELAQVRTVQNPTLGIMNWGRDNSFPQTFKNLIEQSPVGKPAVERTAKFYKGSGFEGDDMVVTPYGLTLGELYDICADDYSIFKAFAIHVNYKLNGKVTTMQPLRIADLRFNEFDELNFASKIGYHPNFGLNAVEQKTIQNHPTKGKIKWFDRFNPSAVVEQIKETGSSGNYLGQVLYFSSSGHSSYPIPTLQAPINFLLADIENSILIRKEVATGFISTYILKTTLDNEDETLEGFEKSLAEAQGARGYGKVITFAGLSEEEVKGTILEEIGSGGSGAKAVVESAKLTYELIQKVINGAYLIPPVLAGADQNNGFSGTDLKDAYFVFNAVTKDGRECLQGNINRILKHSEFEVKEIKVNKLELDEDEEKDVEEVASKAVKGEGKSDEETKSLSLRDLTGKQMQSLQRIVRKYNKGEFSYEQAQLMLIKSFEFSEEECEVWLIKDE
ncbi:portal protein [Tenacibaculum phage Larrie]|nr:portal protein [Tenacibaculum phage Larrie]